MSKLYNVFEQNVFMHVLTIEKSLKKIDNKDY